MCGSIVNIQSATAKNRQGKKEERKKEETKAAKYNDLCYLGGHNKWRAQQQASYGFGRQSATVIQGLLYTFSDNFLRKPIGLLLNTRRCTNMCLFR